MRTNYYLMNFHGKRQRVSKKDLEAKFGRETVKRLTDEAKETFMRDPYVELSFANGILIEFK